MAKINPFSNLEVNTITVKPFKEKIKKCVNCQSNHKLNNCKFCHKEYCQDCFDGFSCNICQKNLVIVKRKRKFLFF